MIILQNDIPRELHPVGLYVKHPYSAGLEFLYKAAEFWPGNKVEVPLEEDKRDTKKLRWVGGSQEIEPVLEWKRCSSLAKLGRVLAYVMRFVRNRRVKKELRQTGPVTATDLRDWSKSIGGGGGRPEHLEMWLIKNTWPTPSLRHKNDLPTPKARLEIT